MKIFLSWSGARSRQIAEIFKGWLPQVIQDVQIFYSPEILRGKLWLDTLRTELEDNSFGIFCITSESLSSLWMSYEAGAIVSRNKNAMAVPLLFGLSIDKIQNTPYAPFQAVLYSREEIFKLVESINNSIDRPLDAARLRKTFDLFWPDLDERISELLPLDIPTQVAIDSLYEQADQGLFANVAHQLVSTAKSVKLVGTGLCILAQDPIRRVIFERARSHECQVEIYLGNPISPNLQTRLIEEETGDWRPSVAYTGLIKRAEMLLREWESYGHPKEISLNMFAHYPTMAIIMIDDHCFLYPYGYTTLGNFSPVLHYSRKCDEDGPMIRYLDRQIELIRRDSAPMKLVSRAFPQSELRPSIEDAIPAALFFIPPAESELYKFGSKIIGYDVHAETRDTADESSIAEAQRYGLHLTISDVLYFMTAADLRWIREEVKFVAASFRSFRIKLGLLEKNYPDPGTIALRVEDDTGNLEALHHEFVYRIYRHSIGSNFTFRTSLRAKGPFTQRDRLMIERYHAPFILSSFRPHFTLMTEVPDHEMDSTYEKIRKDIERQKLPQDIEVNALAIMVKAPDRIHFRIDRPLIRLK